MDDLLEMYDFHPLVVKIFGDFFIFELSEVNCLSKQSKQLVIKPVRYYPALIFVDSNSTLIYRQGGKVVQGLREWVLGSDAWTQNNRAFDK